MPDTGHGAQLVLPRLGLSVDARLGVCTLQNFNRDHESILQQVIVDHAIEDIDSSVVTGARKQRELAIAVEGHLPDGFIVVFERLVRTFTRHVHIKPQNFLIVGAQNEVVALRVHRYARNPLGARAVLADNGLLLKVVLEDCGLRSGEKVRFCRVERHTLHDAISRREGLLRRCFAD